MKERGGGALFTPSEAEVLNGNYCVAKLLLAYRSCICSEQQKLSCSIYNAYQKKIDVKDSTRDMKTAFITSL